MLAAAALLWITLDAAVTSPHVDVGRAWTLAAAANASFQPLFVYPDFQSGAVFTGGFRLAHAAGRRTAFALTGSAGTTCVDARGSLAWRPRFEVAAELSWQRAIEMRAGLRHDDLLRREGALADFRDPTGRMFVGVSVLPLRRGPFAAGASIDYERALPGIGRLPAGLSVTARVSVRP
jgi:hypothetical protein